MSDFVSNQFTLNIKAGQYASLGGSQIQQDRLQSGKTADGSDVFVIADGHGPDVSGVRGSGGELFAEIATQTVCGFFQSQDVSSKTHDEIVELLSVICSKSHNACKEGVKAFLESHGREVFETSAGVLLSREALRPWFVVKGGTTCTIVIRVGYKFYTATVGDSTAKGVTQIPLLHKSQLQFCIDVADPERVLEPMPEPLSDDGLTTHIELSFSPGVTDPDEYCRVLLFEPRVEFRYDSSARSKQNCPLVFTTGLDGELVDTKKIAYYKNVNKEPAALVTTPRGCNFGLDIVEQGVNMSLYSHVLEHVSALAMSRSLGDFTLQPYGLTYKPVINMFDAEPIFQKMRENGIIAMIQIILATDGLWDNMKESDIESDVSTFINDPENIYSDVQTLTTALGNENNRRGCANFGNARDNTTICIIRVTESTI